MRNGNAPRTFLVALLFATASASASAIACGGGVSSSGGAPGGTDPGGTDPGVPGGPTGGPEPSGPVPVGCSLPASPTVTTLGSGVALEPSLATNGSEVFWSQGIGGSTVMRASKTAGGAARALPGATGRVAAADDAAVYVITGAGNAAIFGIVRLPLDGGAPTTIVEGSTSITAVAIDDASIYWTASGVDGDCFSNTCPAPTPSLMRAPKTGGASTTLGAFSASWLRVDGDRIYFAFQVAGDLPSLPKTSIGALPKAGGAPVALASRPDWVIAGIALDANNLYWAESSLTDSAPPERKTAQRLMTIPKSGGAPTTIAAIATHDPREIALDAANVYWLDDQTQALMRAPKAGGAPTRVIGDQVTTTKFGGFGALAVDTAGLYWIADVACGPSCMGRVVALTTSCR